jgi:hypothetical protein
MTPERLRAALLTEFLPWGRGRRRHRRWGEGS